MRGRIRVHPVWSIAAIAVALMVAVAAAGARAEGFVYASDDGAIDGYDAVAYFKAGKPVEGSDKFTHQWKGATWKFATQENRDAFAAMPEKYEPQYGGYCAWAVSQGYTAEIDPDVWRIVDGKLYLNYSKSVQKNWAKDIPGNIAKADGNWPGISAKLTK